jgi:site-specific recombinase XerD
VRCSGCGCLTSTVPLKTASSYRTVQLSEVVSVALAEHVKRTGRPRRAHVRHERGHAGQAEQLRKAGRSAVARAGLEKMLRLHDLSHAYASALITAGESV